ncbi:DUF7305 domain-containing protein [Engelhardtia mirabilis]
MGTQIWERNFRNAAESRRGGALVVSLVAVMSVASMSAVFLQLSHSITKRQTHSADLKRAMYLAEAGLAEAYVGLGMAKTGNVGSETQPAIFGEGLFWVEATDKGGDLIELEATAMAGSARICLGMVVERADVSVGSLGIFGTEDLTVQSGTLIDSYDSSQGTYAEQLASGQNNAEANVGSAGAVTLDGGRGGITIRGDVVPGIGERVGQTGTVTVSGSTAARSSVVALPAPDAPAPLMAAGVNHVLPVPLVVPAGTRGLENISVGAGATIVVVGPATIVTGDLTLASGAEIEFDVTDGPVELFVSGDLTVPDGALLTNSSADPTQVSVQMSKSAAGTYGAVSLGSSVVFHGSVYAPSSAVSLAAGAEFFGAVVADTLSLEPGAQLHYDLAIAEGESSLPRLANWRVVDVPGPLAASSSDPFKALGIDPSACRSPSAAHEDQWLDVDYLNDVGTPSSYSGWEKDFDWTDVSEVTSGSRDGERMTEARVEDDAKTTPPMVTPTGTPADWVADAGIGNAELTDYLVEAAPLTAGELTSALNRPPSLSSSELTEIFVASSPMRQAVLAQAVRADRLGGADLYKLAWANFPLADSVLSNAIESSAVEDAVLRQILVDHSPLSVPVMLAVTTRSVPLSTADLRLINAAQ